MTIRSGIALAAMLPFTLAAGKTSAQTLFDSAIPFGGELAVVSVPFTVSAATNADLIVVDLGTPGGLLLPLDRLYVALLKGSDLIESAAAPGTQSVPLAAGDYELQIVGLPDAATGLGSVSVTVRETGAGPVIVDTVEAFETPGPPIASPAAFEHSVEVTVPGTYEVRISDLAHPAALASLSALVVPAGGTPVGTLTGSGVISFAAPTGVYDIFVFASLAPGQQRGLVGVAFGGGGAAPTFSAVDEIGEWLHHYEVDVTAATTLTMTVTDLQFPQTLAGLASVMTQNGALVGRINGGGSASGAVIPGRFAAYVDASAVGVSSPGTFGLIVENAAAQRLLETAQAVVANGSPATAVEGFDETFEVTQAGSYRLSLVDFGVSGFFDAFDSVTLAVTDHRQLTGSLNAPGTLDFTAQPGTYSLAIIADPAGAAGGSGLLGMAITGGAPSSTIYEQTAGVGSSFHSRQVAVGGSASIDIEATDLAFPGTFEDLRVAVTRGAEREGEIFGGGTFSIDATPGTYFVNILAEPDSATGYSTLGLNVEVSPEAPVIVLSSSATSVVVGGSITLTWSSTDATSCNASGAWTGSRSVSGTASIGPLSNHSTFTLNCSGAGGAREASVRVEIIAEQRSGGGGAIGWLDLLLLATLPAFRWRWKRRSSGQVRFARTTGTV